MDGGENFPRHTSAIPRPNAQGRSLNDITTAANNHASTSLMPPPGSISRKYTQSSSGTPSSELSAGSGALLSDGTTAARPEPPSPKRKTLVEKAGEPRNKPAPNHSASKSLSSFSGRPPSSSLSSRTSSTSSAQPFSRTSHSSSVGHARKPAQPGRQISRPQTSFGYAANNNGSRNRSPRPATSMDKRGGGGDDDDDSVLGKRKVQAWDESARFERFEEMFGQFVKSYEGTANHGIELSQAVELYKSRVQELETRQTDLTDQNVNLRVELDTLKNRSSATEAKLQEAERNHEIAVDDMDNKHRIESESIRLEAKRQLDDTVAQHKEELKELRRRCDTEFEEERHLRSREIDELHTRSAKDRQREQLDAESKDRELQSVKIDLERVRGELEHERTLNKGLQENLATSNSNSVTLESSVRALKARIEFLESGNQEQSAAFARLNEELNTALAETHEAKGKLRKEETLRRKLHNQVQELKGNIRVFCRVRPLLPAEAAEDCAKLHFPDEEAESKEISVQGPEERSSLGTNTTKKHAFSFDHVFGQQSQNSHVFDEISQLVQSALDGYNVCIFCYGQTGSGKTYTMSSDDGMIARAVHQIYDTARSLEERGWTYTMEGSFVEVYNENLNDLLGKAEEFDKKKHEIRHDMQKSKTTITDITTVTLDAPSTVESILQRAATNRSVAATRVNERSSRSHSVFILKLIGENAITGERSEGTLNLVDLAGSERVSQSGATGERLKETQNINRSLSCLADVIGALGQGKDGGHIPYRNSKLTYLLQFSLGGNSKTLMFVNVSPRMEHLGETLTSLRFATKVHNTHIGTAKRQTKVRE